MLVVADATPLNILIRVGCIGVLPRLFQRVLVPPEVVAELTHENTPVEVREYMTSPPDWLSIQPASTLRSIPPLDMGETAAICLAQEVHADAVLLDERAGRRVAAREGLVVIGTLGILERASERGMLTLADAFKRLEQTDFRVDPGLMADALRRASGRPRPGSP